MREVIREYSRAILTVIVAIIIFALFAGGKYILRAFREAKESNEFVNLDEFKYSTYINNNIQLGIFELPLLSKDSEAFTFRANLINESEREEKAVYYLAKDFIGAHVNNGDVKDAVKDIYIMSIDYTPLDGMSLEKRIYPTYFLNGKQSTKEEVMTYINEENYKAGNVTHKISDFEYYTFNKEGNYTISVRVNAEGMYSTRMFSIALINLD